MLYELLEKIDKKVGIEDAKAHCDVPCGIYDPIGAQIAALTVVRMIDIMKELDEHSKEEILAYHNTITRAILVKEEHGEKAKHEIRVIWGDYIKEQHIKQYPQLPGLVHKIMQLGSKARQTVDRDIALQLVEAINEFAEIFWATKNVPTKKAKAPYKPNLELVYPDL